MTSISFNKLMELFKNLKSDAVPRAPRAAEQVNNGRTEEQTRDPEPEQTPQEEQEEEIVIEPEEDLNKNKKKQNKQYSKPMGPDNDEDVNNIGEEKGTSSHANIQATGTVYNIMNSKHVRLGNDFYFGPVAQNTPSPAASPTKEKKYEEEHIEKDNFISLLMEANIKPDHDYLDYISKNLGKNWHSFFRALKFTQGRIETAEINAAGYDISEARYKLLLDWVKNDNDGSLGRLSTSLWEEGERSIVKELSLMYRKSKNRLSSVGPYTCSEMPILNRSGLQIVDIDVKDVRFPTSLESHGSDALHTDPNYSCAYVTTTTENGKRGFGLTFTCGRGTEIIVLTIRSLKRFILGKNAADIFADFAGFWRTITNDSQMRWIGPEKGVAHLAAAAILNSLWDLWARLENKPLWRLLVDMEPEELVSTIDFRYITDVITKEEAIKLLKEKRAGKENRVKYLLENGYPAYTTQVGWLGYSDELVQKLCDKYLKLGFNEFKVKVGRNFEDDFRRCSAVRRSIGPDKTLMVDANQAWSVNEAIEWMVKLAPLKPMWIEEPTSPDDVLGHAAIAKALKPYNIGVATGEMCANRVMFKQFLQSGGMQYCQIDSARIGGINEILAVYLMAEKLKVKVCPHAGGVGLCEMVQHLQYWDYASVSAAMEGRLIEYVDQQHEHFVDPCVVENAKYLAPKLPGYSTEFLPGVLEQFSYPNGSEWQRMIKEGLFAAPDEAELVNI